MTHKLVCLVAVLSMAGSARADVCGLGVCVSTKHDPAGQNGSQTSNKGERESSSKSGSSGGAIGALVRWLLAPSPPESPAQREARLRKEAERRAEWERRKAEQAELAAEGKHLRRQYEGFKGFTNIAADKEERPDRYVRGLYQPVGAASLGRPDVQAAQLYRAQRQARRKALTELQGNQNEAWCKVNYLYLSRPIRNTNDENGTLYAADMASLEASNHEWDAKCGGPTALSAAPRPGSNATSAATTPPARPPTAATAATIVIPPGTSSGNASAPPASGVSGGGHVTRFEWDREHDVSCPPGSGPCATTAPPPPASGAAAGGRALSAAEAAAGYGAGAANSASDAQAGGQARLIFSQPAPRVNASSVDVPQASAPQRVDLVPEALRKSEKWQQLEKQQAKLQQTEESLNARIHTLQDKRAAEKHRSKLGKLDGEIAKLQNERVGVINQIETITDTKKIVLNSYTVKPLDGDEPGPGEPQPAPLKPPTPPSPQPPSGGGDR